MRLAAKVLWDQPAGAEPQPHSSRQCTRLAPMQMARGAIMAILVLKQGDSAQPFRTASSSIRQGAIKSGTLRGYRPGR